MTERPDRRWRITAEGWWMDTVPGGWSKCCSSRRHDRGRSRQASRCPGSLRDTRIMFGTSRQDARESIAGSSVIHDRGQEFDPARFPAPAGGVLGYSEVIRVAKRSVHRLGQYESARGEL